MQPETQFFSLGLIMISSQVHAVPYYSVKAQTSNRPPTHLFQDIKKPSKLRIPERHICH